MNKENLLINSIWPLKNIDAILKNIILILLGTIILTISAKIQIPFWPVPMTMQTYVVLVIGMIYGFKLGFLTLLTYLIEGALGIPVFAKGGGLIYLTGPTAGYLYGMLIASGVIGYYSERGLVKSSIDAILPLILGTNIIFICGVGYLGSIIGYEKALIAGLLPFIPSEFFKIALALCTIGLLWKYFKKENK
tara:strand:- start:1316 stop:1891 length:576 start_codon:yes stop_codon:yes gene_type:complete